MRFLLFFEHFDGIHSFQVFQRVLLFLFFFVLILLAADGVVDGRFHVLLVLVVFPGLLALRLLLGWLTALRGSFLLLRGSRLGFVLRLALLPGAWLGGALRRVRGGTGHHVRGFDLLDLRLDFLYVLGILLRLLGE